ncbi:hypothetical protein PBV88_50855, partial [Streptomyces sp. T21Q-yed]|nr:hypothetical protein [Streptomyces sp. T21Q-yed]
AVAVRWGVTAGAALLVAGCWPYFDVFALAGDDSVDWMHRRLYEHLGGQFWLALLGLPALWRRGSWRDPLVLLFALDCLFVAYGWVSGRYTYGRILGLTLVPLQFALAVELAAPRPWGRARQVLGGAAAVGACVGFLTVQGGAVVPRALDPIGLEQPSHWPSYAWAARHVGACVGFLTVQGGAVVPRALDPIGLEQPSHWPSYAWAARHVGKGEVVISDGHFAPRSIPGYGPNLAAPIWPDPALDERERERRLADVRAYLSGTSTRAERTAIARRYHARWLLLTRWKTVPEEAVVVAWSRGTGEVLARIG